MTASTIAVAELAEKGADIDVLRQMVQFMAQRLMEINVEGRCGTGSDEKSAERINSRNGFRDRSWKTRADNVELKIPNLRQGSYFPEFLGPRRTAEKALTAMIQEAYMKGISTRAVDDLDQWMGASYGKKREAGRIVSVRLRSSAAPSRRAGPTAELAVHALHVRPPARSRSATSRVPRQPPAALRARVHAAGGGRVRRRARCLPCRRRHAARRHRGSGGATNHSACRAATGRARAR